MNADSLIAIEEIKQLKARYFRLLDTKQWEDWAGVFTADHHAWVEDTADVTYAGRDEFVAAVRAILADTVTVHHGHMPEIEVTGPDTARGTWAMFDYRAADPGRSKPLRPPEARQVRGRGRRRGAFRSGGSPEGSHQGRRRLRRNG